MKRLPLLITFALLLGGTIQAQSVTMRSYQDFDSTVDSLSICGQSNVSLIEDTTCFIEVVWSDVSINPAQYKTIFIQGNSLTINDTTGNLHYYVHVFPSQVKSFNIVDDANVDYTKGTLHYNIHVGPGQENTASSEDDDISLNQKDYSSFSEFGEDIKKFVDALVETLDSAGIDPNGYSIPQPKSMPQIKSKRKYSIADRTDLDFLWAFTNWGDQWYNGLMKLDGANNLRTSFSSYQLEEHFAVVMTKHWSLSLGIGYESDVYKMSNNYVAMGAGGDLYCVDQAGLDATSSLQGTSLDGWSTRLVTRYVSMPIILQYRDVGMLNKFKISLGVIPALSFNTGHTGLKHEYERKGRNYQEVEDISSFINPYKVDVRLTFQRKGLGLFLQVPTMPLFIDNSVKIYPIKLGFLL